MSEGFYQMQAKHSPYLRPIVNVGCLMDIPTGSPVKALHGRYVTNGGHNRSVIVVGPGNSYKSALADYISQTAAFRVHRYSTGQKYDTESNVYIPGLENRLKRIVGNKEPDWFESGRWVVVESSEYKGDEWFKMAKEWMYGKKKAGASMKIDTPILDRAGKPLRIILPTHITLDSISKFEVQAVQELRDKTDLGDAKQNMLAMNSGKFKKNMVDELPDMLVSTNTYLTGTVHYGEVKQIDPYAPVHKPLQHVDNGKKMKGVPENITFLSTCMWAVKGVAKLANKVDKQQMEYPLKGRGNDNNVDDLNIITIQQWRCKTGPSGYSLNIVISQKYGVLENLTQFHFLRTHGQFGFTGEMAQSGNFKDVQCILYPEKDGKKLSLTRQTIRDLMDNDRRLSRAVEILADMLQMSQFWQEHLRDIDPRLLELTPATLYQKVKENGYDWNMLLDTRYWWSADDEDHEQLELSTLDIMRMALGTYHPYWLESDKKTIKKKFKKHIDEKSPTADVVETI